MLEVAAPRPRGRVVGGGAGPRKVVRGSSESGSEVGGLLLWLEVEGREGFEGFFVGLLLLSWWWSSGDLEWRFRSWGRFRSSGLLERFDFRSRWLLRRWSW